MLNCSYLRVLAEKEQLYFMLQIMQNTFLLEIYVAKYLQHEVSIQLPQFYLVYSLEFEEEQIRGKKAPGIISNHTFLSKLCLFS